MLGVGAQGDTEAEALEGITAIMTDAIGNPWPDGAALADTRVAEAEMADLMVELTDEGTPFRVHQVTLSIPQPADV